MRLTVSIGGTLVAPGDTQEIIIRRADALLYQSKRAGRNHVTIDYDQSGRPGGGTVAGSVRPEIAGDDERSER